MLAAKEGQICARQLSTATGTDSRCCWQHQRKDRLLLSFAAIPRTSLAASLQGASAKLGCIAIFRIEGEENVRHRRWDAKSEEIVALK